MRRLRGALAGLVLALAPVPALADAITVFADARLKEPFDEVVKSFRESTGHVVSTSYGPSAAFTRHIERGAPVDVLVSADPESLKRLEEKELLAAPPKELVASASTQPRVAYAVANVRRLSPAAAFDFSDYLASPAARSVFKRFGFRVPD